MKTIKKVMYVVCIILIFISCCANINYKYEIKITYTNGDIDTLVINTGSDDYSLYLTTQDGWGAGVPCLKKGKPTSSTETTIACGVRKFEILSEGIR